MKSSTKKQFGKFIGFALMVVMLFVSVPVEVHADAFETFEVIDTINELFVIDNDEDSETDNDAYEIDDDMYYDKDYDMDMDYHEDYDINYDEDYSEEHFEKHDDVVIDNYNSERMHHRFIYGFPDGTVRPDGFVTRAEAATIVFRLLEDDNKFQPTPLYFSDVGHESWYSQAVNYLGHIGILLGYTDGTFKANDVISRAEFSAIVSRFTNRAGNGFVEFSDVNGEHWATPYISTVSENGWVLGYTDGTFRPENRVSRAEFIIVMNLILDRHVNPYTIRENLGSEIVFSDISTMHWAFYDIMEASITHSFVMNQYGRKEWLSLYLPTALAH